MSTAQLQNDILEILASSPSGEVFESSVLESLKYKGWKNLGVQSQFNWWENLGFDRVFVAKGGARIPAKQYAGQVIRRTLICL